MSDQRATLDQALAWHADGLGVAIATVVKTWGSSPRPAGSQLVVNEQGAFVGSVSGGCVEAAVVQEAAGVIRSGEPRALEFGVTNEMAWEVGLACGGKIRVYVHRVPADPVTLRAVRSAYSDKHALVVVTNLTTGTINTLTPDDVASPLAGAVRDAVRLDRSSLIEQDGDELFLHVHNAPLRLVIIGGVHLAQPLARIAAMAGFDVTVVDPRGAFLSEARFPDVNRVVAWPDKALAELALDRRAAVVTLTHDPKIDEPALAAALRSDVFYIGALGSNKTQRTRLERLRKAGFDDGALARIHGPVGLDIGARAPSEIAVSIAAELIASLRREDA